MRRRTFFVRSLLPLFLLCCAPLVAQEQIIVVDSVPAGTPPATEIQLDLVYSTRGPEDETLTGLGLRLHWDSSELALIGLADVTAFGLRAVGLPEADFADFDNDPATDTFVHLAWTDLDGEWPGLGATPTQLFSANFQTSPTFSGVTQVNLSASSTAAGYVLNPLQSLVFADGFESGDLVSWSNAVGFSSPRPTKLGEGLGAGPAMTDLLVARGGELRTLAQLDFPLLDIDGDGSLTALTDGLLVLRHLFGFTGSALIDGAVAPGATRTTAAEIEAFLTDIEPALDVDLDGRLDALTDGVLVMRFLSGFLGSALTDGALGAGAARTDPTEIADFLAVLSDPDGLGDTDGDGVADIDEVVGLVILIDLDGLGVCCLTSRLVTSDPLQVDTDGDGLDDWTERLFRTDPGSSDTDLDGLTDSTELNRYASAPASIDTDGDSRGPDGTGVPSPLFFDGNELALFGTSPALADTDGDARTDFEEANQNATPPLVADVPRLAVELVGEVNVDLEYTSTITMETRMLESTLVGRTDTSGQSSTDTTSSQQTIGASATVTAGVEAGFPGGATASASVSATVSGEYSEETTTSFTEDSSVAVQNDFQESQETAIAESQEITGGTLGTGINIRNLGTVAFTLSDLGITALLRDPDDRQTFRTVATLIPQIPADGFTLGPFNGSTGVLEVADPDISTALATSLLADPAGLYLDVATFSLEDEEGRNFAFLAEVTNARTALLTLDFGNGDVERYRVATLVERNPDGTGAGIAMEKILSFILDIPFETEPRQGSTNPEFPDGVELLTQVRDIATDIDPDTAAFQNSFWAVLSGDPDLTGAAGIPFTTDFQDITLFSGDAISVVYVTDKDRDNLFLREEFLYGTTDEPRDFDGDGTIDAGEEARTFDFDEDGLTDFAEVRTGWLVNVNGLTKRRVYPDPTRPDTDRFETGVEGVVGGDTLADLEEFRGRDGCGPHDPADPDQPDPACSGATDTGDATDPTTPDTDQDGLSDEVDDDPLDSMNVAPTISITVEDFSANTGVLNLTGAVTDPTDPIDTAIIDWGDGEVTCLDNDSGDCPPVDVVLTFVDFSSVDVTHQYLMSNPAPGYTVTITATDDRQPPGMPAAATPVTLGPFMPVLANDDLARYWLFDGELCDYTGNGFDGVLTGDDTESGPTLDRFGGGNDAYCMVETGAGEGTFIQIDNISPVGPGLTLVAWIVPSVNSSPVQGNIFGHFSYARLQFENGLVTFRITDGVTESSVQDPNLPPTQDLNNLSDCNMNVALGDWTFYAATVAFDGTDTTLRLYRGQGGDGSVTEVAMQVVNNTEFQNPDTITDWQLGGVASDPRQCDSLGGYVCYEGRIDDARVYDRPLSKGEIESLLIENPGNISPTPVCPP